MKGTNKAGKKKALIAAAAAVCLWVLIGMIDFSCVLSFKRPIFCDYSAECQDGGSGTYTGLGYSFEIKGNFVGEESLGVTEYTAKIFNIPVIAKVKD